MKEPGRLWSCSLSNDDQEIIAMTPRRLKKNINKLEPQDYVK